MVFISHGYHESPRGELFLKHSVYLFRFRKNTQRIQQAITATNRLHVYILGEIGIGTRKQETREIRIDVNRFCRDVKHVLTPSERIHKFHCTDDDICDRGYHITLINIFQLQILYKYIKNFTAII